MVKQLVSQLPWGHVIRLFQRVKEPTVRQWYMRAAIAQGWSRSVLEVQIDRDAHERQGKAVHNFHAALPPPDSDLAATVQSHLAALDAMPSGSPSPTSSPTPTQE